MDYKMKYYKYKSKYLALQKQQLQIGGKIFQKKQILYIVATISQPKLKKITKQITDKLLGKNIKPYRAPHITLFNLIINSENDDNIIFQDENFYNQIKNIYDETIADKNNPLILSAKSPPYDFTFPGFMPRYFLKNYKSLDPQKILDFRQKIFKLIESFLGKAKIKVYFDDRGSGYYIYSYHGKKLFAESKYYDKWRPHLDFLNSFDIQKHNPHLHEKLNKYYYGRDKAEVLVNEIKDIPQEIYEEINMATQMKNITYAIDHLLQKKFK
jgi:hypothetical protein